MTSETLTLKKMSKNWNSQPWKANRVQWGNKTRETQAQPVRPRAPACCFRVKLGKFPNSLLCILVSPANAQGPFLSSWRQSRGTWVSVVIDICGTSKGEAKARACGEGAIQDLGGGWVKPLTLTQVHQHLALTAGTPVGGSYCNIWKEQQKGSSYLLSSLSRPCNIFLSSVSRQTPGNQERNVEVKEASAPLSRSLQLDGRKTHQVRLL